MPLFDATGRRFPVHGWMDDMTREVDEIMARTHEVLARKMYWSPAQILDARGNVVWTEQPSEPAIGYDFTLTLPEDL